MTRRRSGFTLVELLAVLAVFSVAMGLIVLSIVALQKAGNRVQSGITANAEWDRFVHQFRTDAHTARAYALSQSTPEIEHPDTLSLTLADGTTIEYRLAHDLIQRRVRAGEVVQHRESYGIAPVTNPGWQISRSEPVPLVGVSARLLALQSGHAAETRPQRVESAIGLSPVSISANQN